MALDKTPVNINFAQGLDTKSDSNQVPIGKFLSLQNSVFDKAGALTKRNGFDNITTLPNASQTTITTLHDNLIATGSDLYAYSESLSAWFDKGTIQPVQLNTLPLLRSSTSQTAPDSAVSADGLVCLTYQDSGSAYYQVSDSVTGQQIVSRTLITNGTVPRVFILGRYFIVTFLATVSASSHLRYIAIPMSNPTAPLAASDFNNTTPLAASLTAGYDGVVANNSLYITWAGASNTIQTAYINSALGQSAAVPLASHTSTLMTVTADLTQSVPVIWSTFWDSSSTNMYTIAYDPSLNVVLAVTTVATGQSLAALTSVAQNRAMTLFVEVMNNYVSPYPVTVRTDLIAKATVTLAGAGALSSIIRSVGLGSKAFIDPDNGNIYMLVAYGETNQPTYFLMDQNANLYMRLAYANGGGYVTNQVLPSVSIQNDTYYVPYLIKDYLATTNASTPDGTGPNKTTNLPSGTPVNAIYTQTGINLAMIGINNSGQYSSEIAGALHLTGGQLWEYDGVKPVEHGFHVWPENLAISFATTGGLLTAQVYYYQFTYEWTDNQGNLHRSAPSIPIGVTTTGSTSAVTLYVPTLRLTYKTSPNPVRIVGYRWSTAQQVYYQITSITSPVVNNTTVDYVTIIDAKSDAQILGNTILYTTGGVIEDIAAPASIASALFKNRLFLIDAEDRNLLWFSKQVIENTPVEMSDLLTLYISPTTGAQGSTGPLTALSAMDDKLIMFKKDAIYYLTGLGPDNTGANNDFTDPVYITSTVGCANPNSIVLMPNGIMFQSDKGIWLLGRDLSTNYIGAPVEQYNSTLVASATAIPGTNQVRFILTSGITLMYDYYYSQWGTFSNVQAISATLYQGLHTYLNAFGAVYQEKDGSYVDGSKPVLMSFTTSWISVAGLQGFERFYYGFLLGTYYTPFTLNLQLAYDYNTSNTQSIAILPNNYSAAWGGQNLWGNGGGWGGRANVFEAQFYPQQQKCNTFQVTVNEIYDSSLGVAPGQGLSMSGILLMVGAKKGSRTQKAARSFG